MPSRTLSIQVPENATEGDTLTFYVEEKELEISLPPGVSPLDVLQVQVEVGNDDDDEEDDKASQSPHQYPNSATISSGTGISTLELASGQTLTFDTNLSHLSGTTERDTSPKPHSHSEDDGTHAMIWPSTRLLLCHKKNLWDWIGLKNTSITPIRILELGAGLGCLGMTLACNAPAVSDGERSIQYSFDITDHPSALTLLKANVEKNQALWSGGAKSIASIYCKPLDWNDHLQQARDNDHSSYDIIVGSDLLYNVKQIPALVQTVNTFLSKSGGIILMIVRWRKPDLERAFFLETSKRYNVQWTIREEIGESLHLPCQLNWDEIGDPMNDRSNKYFSGGVQISVNGTPKALVDISEDEASCMTESEYEQWERAHIQVYRGERISVNETSTSTDQPSKKQKM